MYIILDFDGRLFFDIDCLDFCNKQQNLRNQYPVSSYISIVQVDLWFSGFSKPVTPADPTTPYPYDRLANLKDAFFDIFADHSSEPARMDYINMVI
jgi:hypothetical protein